MEDWLSLYRLVPASATPLVNPLLDETSPVHTPFDLLALLLVISAGLAYLNHRVLKLPLTVGLLVGAAAGAMLLIAWMPSYRASA